MLPHVTQVLGVFSDFSAVPASRLAAAAERGSRVHAVCASILTGLWVPAIDPEWAGYIESFKKWLPYVVDVVAVECRLVDDSIGYEGTPDVICRILGDEALTVVDLKTPVTKNKLWAAQCAAYRRLSEANGYAPIKRVGTLRLKPNGGQPVFDEYQHSERDFAAFLSALNAYRWFASSAQ